MPEVGTHSEEAMIASSIQAPHVAATTIGGDLQPFLSALVRGGGQGTPIASVMHAMENLPFRLDRNGPYHQLWIQRGRDVDCMTPAERYGLWLERAIWELSHIASQIADSRQELQVAGVGFGKICEQADLNVQKSAAIGYMRRLDQRTHDLLTGIRHLVTKGPDECEKCMICETRLPPGRISAILSFECITCAQAHVLLH